MISPKIWRICLFLIIATGTIQGQVDTLDNVEDYISPDLIEDFVADSDKNFEYDALLDALTILKKRPLNLNKASADELLQIPMLSSNMVDALIAHRNRFGNFLSPHELQVIPGFSPDLIRSILPFVKLTTGLDDYNVPLGKMIISGENEVYMRWTQFFPVGDNYRSIDGKASKFEGNPSRYYTRYRHSNSNKLSYGFTAEKDAGEAFFNGSNKQGFDFYSAHFYLKNYKKWLRTLALGDFRLSLGQGLIFYSGFGSRKGSQVTQIKRGLSGLNAFRSVDENNFLRGAGAEINLGEKMSIMAFGSIRNRDANQLQIDTIDQEVLAVSSLLSSGLHRTSNEIEDEKTIKQTTIGGSLKYESPNFKIAGNLVYDQLSSPLQVNLSPYNQFYFQGDRITNISVDYKYNFRNVNVFGEWAMSNNGGFAYTNGLLLNLNRITDLAILNRSFGRDYQSLNPAPFAESTGARNEQGTYIGVEIRPNIHWKFSGYYDLYKFNWLRYQVDSPSDGRDFRGRVTYKIKRKLETYLEYREERKSTNQSNNDTPYNFLIAEKRVQARFNFSYNVSKSLVWRTRIDWGFFEEEGSPKEFGTVVYQDFIYKPISFPLHLSTRFAVFDTESYNIRFYSYENNLLNSFSIPSYSSKGIRYYLNLRFKGIRNMTIEARYAQTLFPGAFAVSSTDGIVLGDHRNELSFQVKYKW